MKEPLEPLVTILMMLFCVHGNVCGCVCVCVCVKYVYVCVCVYVYVCMCVYVCARMCICMLVHEKHSRAGYLVAVLQEAGCDQLNRSRCVNQATWCIKGTGHGVDMHHFQCQPPLTTANNTKTTNPSLSRQTKSHELGQSPA
jgi:hypothetical protein